MRLEYLIAPFHLQSAQTFGTKYSGMDQVQFVEDSP